MSRGPRPVELLLVLLLLLGAGLHLGFRADYGKRNFEYAPDMAETPGYEAQDPNPLMADGLTLRTPPAGTVPRGYLPLMDAAGPLETATAWEKLPAAERRRWDALRSPYADAELTPEAAEAVLARGRAVFQNVCATCHGANGAGGTPVTQRGVPPPPRLQDPKYASYSDGHLYHVITLGKGNMAAHANHVERQDRWKLIRFVRTLLSTKP